MTPDVKKRFQLVAIGYVILAIAIAIAFFLVVQEQDDLQQASDERSQTVRALIDLQGRTVGLACLATAADSHRAFWTRGDVSSIPLPVQRYCVKKANDATTAARKIYKESR